MQIKKKLWVWPYYRGPSGDFPKIIKFLSLMKNKINKCNRELHNFFFTIHNFVHNREANNFFSEFFSEIYFHKKKFFF